MKDLQVIGDTCTIACDKDGVNFSVSGDLGKGNIMVRNNTTVDREEVSQYGMSVSTPNLLTTKSKTSRDGHLMSEHPNPLTSAFYNF